MLDMPILKFEKSNKYLQKQLKIQINNKQLILDIITNIGLMLSTATGNDKKHFEDVIESSNMFLQTITTNIATIKQLDLEIKNITNDLTEILSEKNKPSKTKEFYIAAFTSIKQTIVVYSKKINQLEISLEQDNKALDDFIKENNIKYNYESTTSSSEEDGEAYKFTGFSATPLSDEEISIQDDINIDVDSLSDNILAPIENESAVNDFDYELNEKIDKLTNEFRSILLDNANQEIDTSSVISLIKEALPNKNIELKIENIEDTSSKNYNIDELITGIIDEAELQKASYSSDELYKGLNVNTIADNFSISDVEVFENINNIETITPANEEIFETEIIVPENEEDVTQKLSYSEMFSSFYTAAPTEKNTIQIPDFSPLENSFNEFDKLLTTPVETTVSTPQINTTIEETVNISNDSELIDLQDDELLNLISEDDLENEIIEESLLEDAASSQSVETITVTPEVTTTSSTTVSGIIDEIIVEDNQLENTNEFFNKQIEKIEKGNADNDLLLISEKTKKIYLPYKTNELLNYIHSYPNLYKSLSDVVRQEFILPYTYFAEHPKKSRYSEAYNLLRNREGKNIFSATFFAIKMAQKSNLNPAIIASCKSRTELDSYLECLNLNKLDNFKEFKIAYEVSPII